MQRFTNFQPDLVGTEFSQQTCNLLTGNSVDEMIKLTGIYGYLRPSEIEFVLDGDYPDIRLIILSKNSSPTTRKIEVQLEIAAYSRSLYDALMLALRCESRTGFKIFSDQVKEARLGEFESISLIAARETYIDDRDQEKIELIGYKVWNKFGFLLNDPSKVIFKNILRDSQFEDVESLQDLYKIPNGKEFWSDNGESWGGFFGLDDNHESMSIFQEYRRDKLKIKL